MNRRHWLKALALSPLFSLGGALAQESFKLGVAPHTSARVILEMYQPLRRHLEKTIGIPVEVLTAPDFTEFARRAINQEYDLAITTGHQARLLQTDAGYLPLLTYKADFRAVALVARDSSYRQPADLKGTAALGLSPSSLVTLWGLHWLKQNGLGDMPVRYVSAADSISRLVLGGDASVAFASLANFQKLPADQREALRIFAESGPMAGRVYILNRRRARLASKIEGAIWSFADSPAGRLYLENNRLEGYRRLNPKELDSMEPYADEVRAVLRQGK